MCRLCLVAALLLVVVMAPIMACAQMPMATPPREGPAPQAESRPVAVPADMSGMEMPGMQMPRADSASVLLIEESSGTSVQPRGWSMPMVMTHTPGWQLTWMAQAFVVDVQQSHVTRPAGAGRGSDALYSANWGMLSAQHAVAAGSVMLRTMLSLEPATITSRRFPELFQTGETAFGRPIVDGQHPHNFVMEIGAQYAHSAGKAVASGYYAPVGDPAIGPTAYPHRASAAELPQATLGHHYEDSTHIAYNVATAEVAWHKLHVDASGFHGREPGENRWNIGFGPMDSWAGRLTWLPAKDWQAQISTGRLHHPEAEAGEEERTTASVEYASGERAASLIWGRDYKTAGHYAVEAITAEGVLPLAQRNYLTGRFEWSERDELQFGGSGAPRWFDVAAYTLGYTREVWREKDVSVAVGANGTGYQSGRELDTTYGSHPWAMSAYLRVRLKPAASATQMQ